MKNIILFLLIFSFFESFAQNETIKRYLIPKESIGIKNSNLKLNGFYYTKYIRLKSEKDTIKFIAPLILFENGIYTNYDYTGNGGDIKKKVLQKMCVLNKKSKKKFRTIISFFECFSPSIKHDKAYNVYSINKKTIKMQILFKNRLIGRTGIILNDSTFVINKLLDYNNKKIEDVNLVYYLKKSVKPDSTKLKLKHIYSRKNLTKSEVDK